MRIIFARWELSMNKPLFSVVVPIYNVESYLDRCVKSLVNQTYKNLEIILVDDGSPDKCPKICDGWAKADSRIRVIHKENGGLGFARNSGIEIASGDFITFVDSDDYLIPDAIERCILALSEHGSDTLLFGRYDAYPDGKVTEDYRRVTKKHYTGETVTSELLPWLFSCGEGYGVSACSKVFSRKLISDYNMRFRSEREIISEDAYFCIDYFAKAENVLVIPDRFYCYYKNEGSLSRTYRADRQEKNNAFVLQTLTHIKELSLPEGLAAYVKSKYHIFTLAAMKHIVTSALTKAEKKAELRKIYKDPVLVKTVTKEVLRTEPSTIRILMLLLKYRLYFVCDLLLRVKTK